MNKWEYTQISVKIRGGVLSAPKFEKDDISKIHLLGQEGWELIQAIPVNENFGRTATTYFIFKRLKR